MKVHEGGCVTASVSKLIKESCRTTIRRFVTLGSLWHDYFLRVKSTMLENFNKYRKSFGSQVDYTKVWN